MKAFWRRIRRPWRGDERLKSLTVMLYVLVMLGGGATLVNLKTFRDAVLAEAHRQMVGTATTLARNLPLPLDTQDTVQRLVPLRMGMGSGAVIAVAGPDGTLRLSLPPSEEALSLSLYSEGVSGNFDAAWPADGIERIWGYAWSDRRPLAILVGIPRAQVTAGVVQLAWHMAALMVALAFGAILLAHLLRLLRARRRAESALRASNRAAIAASQAKADFLANMSHELRTPMTGILGMADLLLGTRLDDEQKRMLGTMRASAKTLLTVLNDVLDFSKVEAGQLELESIDFDVQQVLHDTTRLLFPGAMEKGLFLKTDIAPDSPRWVKGDPSRLQQVLFNLVGNAVKFTEAGGITVGLRPQDGQLLFSVTDTGIGIDPAAMARLFSPFTQADVSTTRRFGGTGLGLAISKRLVNLMGGDISADSAPGRGSTFYFQLSLPEGHEVETQADIPLPSPGRPLKVLVAEDNPVNQELIQRMLERMGHQTVLAEHGADALELAATQDFDVILMDMQMPVMDGETATRLIRSLPDGRASVPVVALTADAVLDHRDRYLSAGLDFFLTKPVSMKTLAHTLREAVDRGHDDTYSPIPPTAHTAEEGGPAPMSEQPVIDDDYLEDMRQWVGDDTLLNLLASAPDSFVGELNLIRTSWETGDMHTVRETAHRLKGAAGSVGCRRLSDLAHTVQRMENTQLNDALFIEQLEKEVTQAATRVLLWRPQNPS